MTGFVTPTPAGAHASTAISFRFSLVVSTGGCGAGLAFVLLHRFTRRATAGNDTTLRSHTTSCMVSHGSCLVG